jgi:hypothetical protein
MHFEENKPFIDCLSQPEPLRKHMHGPNTAAGDRSRSVGYLIVDIGGRELWTYPTPAVLPAWAKPRHDSLLTGFQLTTYLGLRSKLLDMRRTA